MHSSGNPTIPIRILLLEANEQDRADFCRRMQKASPPCLVRECGNAKEAQALLADDPDGYDLLVVDQKLPDAAGIDFCRDLLQRGAKFAMVLLTRHGSEQLAVTAFKSGIHDYIIKDKQRGYLDLLPAMLPEVVNKHRERDRRRQVEAALEESQLRLQQIVAGSTVATFVIDQNHVVTHWNKACEVMTGIAPAQMVGTRQQWRAFYPKQRPVMADLILDQALEPDIQRFYQDRFRKSDLIDGAYEAEGFFNKMGEHGRWLFFTAAPLRDMEGRIIGAIETLQDFTERRHAEAALRESEERYRQLSITDSLTKLYNSRQFYSQLKAEILRSSRYNSPLSLLVLDIDNFKHVNDTCGHLEGDRVLVKLADAIRSCLRATDSGYRHGGEEFAGLLPETTLENAHIVAERLRAHFAAEPHKTSSTVDGTVLLMPTTVSIGVAELLPDEGFEHFMRRADGGTYEAKRLGKNRVAVVASTQPPQPM